MEKLKNSIIGILGIGYLGQNLSEFFKSLDKTITIIEIKKNELEKIIDYKFDFFINCAGNSGDFRNNILETVDSNISLSTYLLKNLKVKYTYIYLSTSRVYGFVENENIIFNEDYIYNKSNLSLDYIYDGSKLLTESLLLHYANNLSYNIIVLRLSNVYGNFKILDDTTLIKKIIRCYLENKKISIPQNKYSKKNYIHIYDFMNAIKEILSEAKTSDIFNLGSEENLSLNDITEQLSLEAKFTNEKKLISIITSNKFKNHFPNWKISNNFVQYTHELKRHTHE
jgi:nucleoside-diphosphate-sugar epimerase